MDKKISKKKGAAILKISTVVVSASKFGSMVGCTLNGVKKMFGSKLTEGVSYKKTGSGFEIYVEAAKEELKRTVKVTSCKNEKLLEFIGVDKSSNITSSESGIAGNNDNVAEMSLNQVREEQAKSELRLSLIEEKVQEGKYVERIVVEKNLEAMGIEIRNSMTSIAARVAAPALASGNERDAENIIHKGIEDALLQIATILEKDIAPIK